MPSVSVFDISREPTQPIGATCARRAGLNFFTLELQADPNTDGADAMAKPT
jgi:hypothetical protein